MTRQVTYYTVADARFFVGAAALVNSLRLTGNAGEIVLLDYGLDAGQRRRLEPVVTLLDVPDELGENPVLVKPYPHRLSPSGIVCVIDSDIIVTRELDDLAALAEAGRIPLYPVNPEHRRWFPEWAEIFGLRQPLRSDEPYYNAGFVMLSQEAWPALLSRWWEASERIPPRRTTQFGVPFSDPTWGAEQDALNALLMSELPAGAVAGRPMGEGPREEVLPRVRADRRSLACTLDGEPVAMLHYSGGPKPWERAAWMRVRPNAYVDLLPRLLFADDVPVRVEPREVPAWLRPGAASTLSRAALGAVNVGARAVVRRAPKPIAARLKVLRDRLGPR